MLLSLLFALDARAGKREREPRTELCAAVHKAVKSDAKKRDIKAMIKDAEDVTPEDVECLSSGRLPGYVGLKALARQLKLHGLESLPTSPVELMAVVPDPCAIAAAQGGWEGFFGEAACFVGVTEPVSEKVTGEITARARAALEDQGVAGTVTFGPRTFEGTSGTTWEGGTKHVALVTPGIHYVLEIHIPDAIAAARAARGDFMVGLGARIGMDIIEEVKETVRRDVWSQLAENGVPSILVEL